MPLTLSLCSRIGGTDILRLNIISVKFSSAILYQINGKLITAVVDPAEKVASIGVEM